MWCESDDILLSKQNASWELPTGNRAIEITSIPSIECLNCGMIYQKDSVHEEIEEQLYLVDNNKIESSVSYVNLLKIPRLLKENYFKV
ncbi:YokU family protein [Bacillus sp. LL01]|uniref:YokU family protein n=1 Tax=Bacillus sp. LL01 TaxID=1665556 RepID=UPI0009E3A637|nr:YokU family protein [Bacillus sp. LL01]